MEFEVLVASIHALELIDCVLQLRDESFGTHPRFRHYLCIPVWCRKANSSKKHDKRVFEGTKGPPTTVRHPNRPTLATVTAANGLPPDSRLYPSGWRIRSETTRHACNPEGQNKTCREREESQRKGQPARATHNISRLPIPPTPPNGMLAIIRVGSGARKQP
ncbi:unnamed protein product, partial [Ectocarpus sp. 8 AP-2014]